MDTKWRRFSRSRWVKLSLALLYIACFAAMGIIWAFAPAMGYLTNGGANMWDALMADDYYSSKAFADRVSADYNVVRDILHNFSDSEIAEKSKALDFYCRVQYGRRVILNNGADRDFTYTIYAGTITSDDVNIPMELSRKYFQKSGQYYTEIGYTNDQYTQWQYSWYIMRRNAKIIVISVIALFVVSMVPIVLFARVAGQTAEGSVEKKWYHSIPYELYMTALICVSVAIGAVAFNNYRSCDTINERTLYMCGEGALMALAALIILLMVYTCAVRAEHKKALTGSLIFRMIGWIASVLKWVLSQLKRFVMCCKEVLTGEIYKGCVTQRMLFIDCGFIAVSCFVLILAFSALFNSNAFVFVLAIFIEIIALILFLYGRHLVLRDGALLEQKIKQMHSGIYSEMPKLSKNSPYTQSMQQLSELSEQYRHSIDESIKAERMKLELVTNVSHDLKTPLTSIIGYVELLSKEDLRGDAAEYVSILRLKSERLKNIVSDVFELAKTTSGEIVVEKKKLDLTKLSYQTLGELEDRIAQSGLTVKTSICEPPVTVISDGKRLYRVIQNILDNALKYSLKGTRIYYTLETGNGKAYIIVKNIASYEMTFTKDEIMERFTRGDKARSTEGTGLGLSIAQGFALACGGDFDIDIDGDMFKATLSLPLADAPAEAVDEAAAVSVNE